MVKEIRVYIEGDSVLRKGFNNFLKSEIDRARQRRLIFKLIAGGSKAETIKDFMTAARTHKDAINIVLIDSDKPDNGNLIAGVKRSASWNAEVGAEIQDAQIHFMIQIMESWFLADRDALKRYYGQGFHEGQLPGNPNVERISKSDVVNGLANATRGTRKKKYHKTRHAPDLLYGLDVDKVRSNAPSCKRLFASLRSLIIDKA